MTISCSVADKTWLSSSVVYNAGLQSDRTLR